MFYQISEFEHNSIHGKVTSSNRRIEECVDVFCKKREKCIKDGTFVKDIVNEKEYKKFHTTEKIITMCYKIL